MSAATVIAGSQLRRGWRPLLALGVLVALASGLGMVGIAGARRTASVLDRAVERTEAWDVLVNPDEGRGSALTLEAIAALPMVADASRMDAVFVVPEGGVSSQEELEEFPFPLVSDGGGLFRFARPVVSAGRLPDPTKPDELFVDRTYADDAGIEIGDRMAWRIVHADKLTEFFANGGDDGSLAAATSAPDFGVPITMTVVGIGTALDSLVVDEGFEPQGLHATPAFMDVAPDPLAPYWGALVRLTDPSELEAFRSAVDALVPDELVVYQTFEATRPKLERAISPGAVTLLAFGLVAAGLGLLLVGQAISRRLQLDALDSDVLAALGTTRRERFAAALLRIAAVATAGAVVGGVLAWLLSPSAPAGPGRRIEPDPGFDVDAVVLGLGVVLTIVLVVAVAAPIAWRNARVSASTTAPVRSVMGRWLASAGAPLSVTTGVRFGLEPGRGSTAVPTRATLVAAATGVVVAVGTLVFAGSIDAVVATPRLYGADWTYAVEFAGVDDEPSPPPEDFARVERLIAADPDVDASNIVGITEVAVDGNRLPAIAFERGGSIGPTIAAGRSPNGAGEIALGRTTMGRLGVGIGDHVALATPAFEGTAEVVGRAVLPGVGLYQASDKTALGEGVIVDPEAIDRSEVNTHTVFAIRTADGADAQAMRARLSTTLAEWGDIYLQEVGRPADVQSLERIRKLPLVLCAVLAGLIAATVVHALSTAVRRRRRDLAVLEVLGASRRSLRSVGLFQALTVAVIAVIVGVPLGVVIGRAAWSALAEAYGTAAEPVVPVGALALVAAAVVTLAAAAGWLPAARALRRRPADILRTE
jgi:FtsX-like permease family